MALQISDMSLAAAGSMRTTRGRDGEEDSDRKKEKRDKDKQPVGKLHGFFWVLWERKRAGTDEDAQCALPNPLSFCLSKYPHPFSSPPPPCLFLLQLTLSLLHSSIRSLCIHPSIIFSVTIPFSHILGPDTLGTDRPTSSHYFICISAMCCSTCV